MSLSRYFECPLCTVEEQRECCRRESPGLCWVCEAKGLFAILPAHMLSISDLQEGNF